MQKNKLGTTDIEVSKICLGTMTWGCQNTEEEAHEQLDYALDNGINFIDTAELYAIPIDPKTYGKTESYIGNRIKKRGRRDDFVLATKVAGPGKDHIRNNAGFSSESILQAVDSSLSRLQTDYIDLYQLHWPERPMPLRGKREYSDDMRKTENNHEERIEEILTTLQKIHKAGKVRHFGLSNETPRGTMKFLQLAEKHGLPRMQSIQNGYCMIRRDYEVGLAEVSLQEKCGLLAYSTLAGGMLTGKYRDGKSPEGSRFDTRGKRVMPYYTKERALDAIEKYQQIADDLNISLTQLALAWVNDRSFVTSNIIGATSMEQLKENISSANIVLSKDTRDAIDDIHRNNPSPACW